MENTTATRCGGCGEDVTSGARYCQTCETVTVHAGFTRAELKDAFDRVCDLTNWKNPINRVLIGTLSKRDRAAIECAVVFYAGCNASFAFTPGARPSTRVTAVGYYVAVGA
jgi:hypothetical protein